jgi:glutathione S-transferase
MRPRPSARPQDGSLRFGQLCVRVGTAPTRALPTRAPPTAPPHRPALEVKGFGWVNQSNTILRFLGRRLGRYGSDEASTTAIDMYLDAVEDLRFAYGMLVYRSGFTTDTQLAEAVRKTEGRGVIAGPTGHVSHFEQALERNTTGAFLVGSDASVADFALFDILDAITVVVPDLLAPFPRLAAWFTSMKERPGVKKYIESAPAHRAKASGVAIGNGTAW